MEEKYRLHYIRLFKVYLVLINNKNKKIVAREKRQSFLFLFFNCYFQTDFGKSQFLNATLKITKYRTNDRSAPATKSTIECCFKNIVDRQIHIVSIREPIFIRLPAFECFNTGERTRHM